MRALVISGGGSKGAFAGGIAQYLIEGMGHQYDLFIGTSTGGLLTPYLALGHIQQIKDIYISVTQNDVFSNCPFKVKKNSQGVYQISIHHLNVIKNFIFGSKTFGESHNLLALIQKTLSEQDFINLKNSSKEVICTVSNLSKHRIEYKSSRDYSYEEFCQWM